MDFNKYKSQIIKNGTGVSTPAFTYLHTNSHCCKINGALVKRLGLTSTKKTIGEETKDVAEFQVLPMEEGKFAIGAEIFSDEPKITGVLKGNTVIFYSRELGGFIEGLLPQFQQGKSYTYHPLEYSKVDGKDVAIFQVK